MSKSGYEVWVKASGNTSARTDVPSTSPVDIQIVSDMKSGGYIAVDRIYEATPIDIAVAAQTQFAKFMLQPGDPTSMLQAIQTKADSVGYS
jgi:multiple sugar transport system substrate-binding protein